MANAKPKTTKTKTTKKSTKNKKGLLSNLYFGSRKAQFLIAIISFALIGGGVMVYKSFAATTIQNCNPNTCLNARVLGRSARNATDPTKNNAPVYILKNGGVAYTGEFKIPSGSGKIKVCTTVKSLGGNVNIFITGIGDGRGGSAQVTATPQLSTLCNDNWPQSAYRNFAASVSNESNTEIQVHGIEVQIVPPSQPQQSPSK